MGGFDLLYLAGLAMITGYLLVGRVPSMLHTTLLAGASLVHGLVLVGAIVVLAEAQSLLPRLLGALAVALATANVVGGLLVTDRLLALFERGKRRSVVVPASRDGGTEGDA